VCPQLKMLQNAFVRPLLTFANVFQLVQRQGYQNAFRFLVTFTLWLSSREQLFIPTIDFILNCYKTNRGSSSTSRLGLLWWKWFALLKCNHFPGIHLNVHWCTFRCIPVVRYTWLMYPLEFLWSEVWKCYIFSCKYWSVVSWLFTNVRPWQMHE